MFAAATRVVNELKTDIDNRQIMAGLIMFPKNMVHLSRRVFVQELVRAIVQRSSVIVKLRFENGVI